MPTKPLKKAGVGESEVCVFCGQKLARFKMFIYGKPVCFNDRCLRRAFEPDVHFGSNYIQDRLSEDN